jgi:hypothetical protein
MCVGASRDSHNHRLVFINPFVQRGRPASPRTVRRESRDCPKSLTVLLIQPNLLCPSKLARLENVWSAQVGLGTWIDPL